MNVVLLAILFWFHPLVPLQATAVVRGHVEVAGDGPMPRLWVQSTSADGRLQPRLSIEPAADGTFEHAFLQGEFLNGIAVPDGYRLLSANMGTLDLTAGAAVRISNNSEIQLRVAARDGLSKVHIGGKVTGFDSALAAGDARIVMKSATYANTPEVLVKADRTFDFPEVVSGRYILHIEGTGIPPGTCVPLFVRDRDIPDVRIAPAIQASPAESIRVISAIYGAGGGSADVTPVVARAIRSGTDELYAAPFWLEVDPAPGATKSLVVFYENQCEENVFAATEPDPISQTILAANMANSRVTLPAVSSQDGEELTIVQAFYGLGSRFTQITPRLRQLIKPDTPPITVDDATLDRGTGSKVLIVTYTYKGARVTMTAFGGSRLSYFNLVTNADEVLNFGLRPVELPEWLPSAQPDPPREPGTRGPGAGQSPHKEVAIVNLLKAIAELEAIEPPERTAAIRVQDVTSKLKQAIAEVQTNLGYAYPPASDKPVVSFLRSAAAELRLRNAIRFVNLAVIQLNASNPGRNPQPLSFAVSHAREALDTLQQTGIADRPTEK